MANRWGFSAGPKNTCVCRQQIRSATGSCEGHIHARRLGVVIGGSRTKFLLLKSLSMLLEVEDVELGEAVVMA